MDDQMKKENNPVISKIEKIQKWFRIIYIVLGPVYIFGMVLYKGIHNFRLELFQALILGLFLALIVLGILLLIDLGLLAWGESTTWLTEQFKKYPKARRVIIISLSAGMTFGSIY